MGKIIKLQGKKIITFLSVFSILAASVMSAFIGSQIKTTASTPIKLWDYTTDSEWLGSGTQADPYQIYTAAELQGAILSNGVNSADAKLHFKLMNDIYINDVSKYGDTYNADWKANYEWLYTTTEGVDPLGMVKYAFRGELDGNFKTVYGLYTNSVQSTGLIPCAYDGAVIKNLTLAKSYIGGSNQYYGAIVGKMQQGTRETADTGAAACIIQNVGVDDTVTVASTHTDGVVGGVVSLVRTNTTITNCYSQVTLTGAHKYGIAADGWGYTGTVSNCYSVGNYPVQNKSVFNTSCSNVYTTVTPETAITGVTTVNDESIKGLTALTNMPALNTYYFEAVENDYPVLANASYAGGDGSENNPYQISTAGALYRMVSEHTIAGDTEAWYELTNDIYLNDVSATDWYDRGAKQWLETNKTNVKNFGFKGHLDGNGYIVHGLYYNLTTTSEYGYGLIPHATGTASVTDISLKNVNISDTGTGAHIGALIGLVNPLNYDSSWNITESASVSITRCIVDDTVTIINSTGNGYIGGFVGNSFGGAVNFTYCGSAANMTGKKIGALQGTYWGAGSGLSAYNSYCVGKASHSAVNCDATLYTTDTTNASGATAVASAEAMKGDAAETNMPNLIWGIWTTTEGYPRIVKDGENYFEIGEVWNGTTAAIYSGGTGTESDPYIINNAKQLRKAVVDCGTTDGTTPAYFKLAGDIYINNTTGYTAWATSAPANNWYDSSLGKFLGSIDGDGYAVYGLYAKSTDSSVFVGLLQNIGSVDGGVEIKNLHIRESYIYGEHAGALIGTVEGWGASDTNLKLTLTGCSVDNTVTVDGAATGGFAGNLRATVTVKDCYSAASLNTADEYDGTKAIFAGAISGDYWSGSDWTWTVTNFYSVGHYPLSIRLHDLAVRSPASSGIVFTNVYSLTDWETLPYWAGVTTQITTYDSSYYNGMHDMVKANSDAWYQVPSKAPLLRNRGQRMLDASCDDNSTLDSEDLVVLRKNLLGVTGYENVINDINGDGKGNVLDIVRLKKKCDIQITNPDNWQEQTISLNESFVKQTGRTVALSTGLAVDNSASQIEFYAYAKGDISVTAETAKEIYFTVYINGERQPKRISFENNKTQTIATNLEPGNYTIRLVRETENKNFGVFTILSLTLTGGINKKPVDKDLYIEFIGDSITAGTGNLHGYVSADNLTTISETKNIANCPIKDANLDINMEQDVTNGYSFLTAEKLNADVSVIACSGIALSAKWNSFDPYMEDFFEYASYERKVLNDFTTARQPDVAVINLGTNDYWMDEGGGSGAVQTNSTQYAAKLIKLVNRVRTVYPDVKIVFAVGLMSELPASENNTYYAAAQQTIAEFNENNIFDIFTYDFNVSESGHGRHPSKDEHEIAAAGLAEYIQNTVLDTSASSYSLVWNDEFNGTSLDNSKWVNLSKMDYPENEIVASEEVTTVSGGSLNLDLRLNANSTSENLIFDAPYSIANKENMAFKYGYLEIRAKVPFKHGVWPGFWMVSNDALGNEKSNEKGAYNIETDIIEVFGNETTLMPNIHKWYYNLVDINANTNSNDYHRMISDIENANNNRTQYAFADTATANDWHTYGMLWTEDSIQMLVDGVVYHTYNTGTYWNFEDEISEYAISEDDNYPFNQYQYILFNCHPFTENLLGGIYRNQATTAEDVSAENEFQIDYVRLYQTEGQSIKIGTN